MTNCHEPDGLDNKYLFLTVLVSRSSDQGASMLRGGSISWFIDGYLPNLTLEIGGVPGNLFL